ncbi:hypothetical protein [Streptomyces melanogenes]
MSIDELNIAELAELAAGEAGDGDIAAQVLPEVRAQSQYPAAPAPAGI